MSRWAHHAYLYTRYFAIYSVSRNNFVDNPIHARTYTVDTETIRTRNAIRVNTLIDVNRIFCPVARIYYEKQKLTIRYYIMKVKRNVHFETIKFVVSFINWLLFVFLRFTFETIHLLIRSWKMDEYRNQIGKILNGNLTVIEKSWIDCTIKNFQQRIFVTI